jgi:hypothetical protein
MSEAVIPTGVSESVRTTKLINRFDDSVIATGLGAGGTAVIKFKVQREDGDVFDFSDSTFKATPTQPLSAAMNEPDVTNFPGVYLSSFALDTIVGLNINDVYYITVIEDAVTKTVGNLEQEGTIRVAQAYDEAIRTRKLLQNKQELVDGSIGNLVVYEDDGLTVMQTWSVKDISNLGIVNQAAQPANREPV